MPGELKIRDRLYVRTIVVDNGITGAALVLVDIGNIPDNIFNKYVQRIEKETGIPAMIIFISVSHSYSSISLRVNNSVPVDALSSFGQ